MKTITIEIDRTSNGKFQPVERSRENGAVVNEIKFQAFDTLLEAEHCRDDCERAHATAEGFDE